MQVTKCFLCQSEIYGVTPDGRAVIYDCHRCGPLRVTHEAIKLSECYQQVATDEKRDAVSHVARRWHRPNDNPLQINADFLDRWFEEAELAKPLDQVRNLITFLGNYPSYKHDFAKPVEIKSGSLSSIVGGRWSRNWMDMIIIDGVKKGYIEDSTDRNSSRIPDPFRINLTVDGWAHFEELSRENVDNRQAFMAMAFGNTRLDQVYHECFVPGVAQAGFDLRRLDQGQGAGLIDDPLRVAIRTSKFVVVDLSTGNKGAYWEAGFAEGLGKHVIYVCEDTVFHHRDASMRPHFDTAHLVTVQWSWTDLKKASENLADTIRNTFPLDSKMSNEAAA